MRSAQFVVLVLVVLIGSARAVPIRLEGNGTDPDEEDILYVTFHGGDSGINSVMAYKAGTGEELGQVLTNAASVGLRELRGMRLLPNGNLLVCNSWKVDSRILQFSKCNGGNGRSFVGTLVSPTNVTQHPYGMAICNTCLASGRVKFDNQASPANNDPVMFVSAQDGDIAVSYFNGDTGKAFPATESSETSVAGAWLAMQDDGATRGVSVYHDKFLLLARQKKDHIHVYRISDQSPIAKIDVSNPIATFIDQDRGILFVGSNDGTSPAIFAFSLSELDSLPDETTATLNKTSSNDPSFEILATFSLGSTYAHPAGIALSTSKQTLYFLTQNPPALLKFDISSLSTLSSAKNKKDSADPVLIATMTTAPESLLLSPCFR